MDDEATVFYALMDWADVNGKNCQELEPLMKCVRLRNISQNYLNDMVTAQHSLAATVPGFLERYIDALAYNGFSQVKVKPILIVETVT